MLHGTHEKAINLKGWTQFLHHLVRILRYRGNSYASPKPINAAPRPGARSYRWVKYAIESNKVVPLRQNGATKSNDQLAA